MKRKAGVVLVVVVLIVVGAAQLRAQGTLTLEGLAERFELMTAGQDALREQLTALEATVEAANVLAGVSIREENRCSPYKASAYNYPDSLEADILREMDGHYYSPYTGEIYDGAREVDIEHIVARSEAHDSGLCAADRFTRLAFASDMLNLTFAPSWLNRDVKGAKDVAEWLPEVNQCWYVNRVVQVKRKHSLSMDQEEAAAALEALDSCASFGMVRPKVTITPTTRATAAATVTAAAATPTPTPPAPSEALSLYDDDGNGRITCAEAREHDITPVRSDHPAYEYMQDRDGDGVVCED